MVLAACVNTNYFLGTHKNCYSIVFYTRTTYLYSQNMADTNSAADPTRQDEDVIDDLKAVNFKLAVIKNEECCRCHERSDVLQILALVYYSGRDKQGRQCVVESRWSSNYCQACLAGEFGMEPASKEDVMFT